jgi:hypothetical protein
MATTKKDNPSEAEIASAWKVYRNAGSALNSRTTALLITQGLLVIPFVAAAVWHGDFDSKIGFFVISALAAAMGLFLSIGAKPKIDSILDGMNRLRQDYLMGWKPYGEYFGAGVKEGESDSDRSADYLRLVPDAFAMFWAGALLVDFYLLIVALDALH